MYCFVYWVMESYNSRNKKDLDLLIPVHFVPSYLYANLKNFWTFFGKTWICLFETTSLDKTIPLWRKRMNSKHKH